MLAGWWRLLAPVQPQALWVGHLLLHRVEALVRVTQRRPLDRFRVLLLRALADLSTPAAPPPEAALLQRLHLEGQVLRQALRELSAEGLAQPAAAGGYQPTDLARAALQQQEYPAVRHERRQFCFAETAVPERPVAFVNLRTPEAGTAQPWTTPEGWHFDPAVLLACVRQPPEWKQQHGFPPEVEEVLALPITGDNGPVAEWQRVVVDRPERLPAVLVQSAAEGRRLLVFSMKQDGWVLTPAPVLTLGTGWQEVFPALADEPLETWWQAWRVWCQQRQVPMVEVSACVLERRDYRLVVKAPPRLVDRLRSARSDALKGEAWLLAGEGRIRAAALVEMVEDRG